MEITPPAIINTFLKHLHSKGESAADYDIEQFVSSIELMADAQEDFYDYLVNFSSLATSQEERMVIKENLRLYQNTLLGRLENCL